MVNESITCTWLIKADYYETIELVILDTGARLEDNSKHILKVKRKIISGLQIRVRIGKLFSLFLIQNICCGYSKKPSQ